MEEFERDLSGYKKTISTWLRILGGAIVLAFLIYTLDIPRDYFGYLIYPSVYSALYLAFMLIVVFSAVRLTPTMRRDQLPWYDILFIVAGVVTCVYIIIKFPEAYKAHRVNATFLQQILGWIIFIVLIEAVRRTIGLALVIIPILFFLHAKLAVYLPGLLGGPAYQWSSIWSYMYVMDTGVFGQVMELCGTVILGFIIFGAFLEQSGGGKFYTDLGVSLCGRIRGGAAQACLITTGIVGGMSGSPMAIAGAIGPMTVPLMKKNGFSPEYSAGVLALGATGAVLTPPILGAVAFIMSAYTGVSYGKIALASILPTILYYACICFQVDFKVVKDKIAARMPEEQIPRIGKVMKEGWPHLIPFAVLVYFLMVRDYNPTTSVLYATASLIIVSMFRKDMRITPRKIWPALETTAVSMIMVTPVCALVGIVTGSVAITGLGINLSVLLTRVAGGSLFLLAVFTWVAGYVAGMGISQLLTYILMALLVAPAIVQFGVPILAVHMFIFYSVMAMFFTPPLAAAVWMSASIAGANGLRSALWAMRLGIAAYIVPFAIIYKPALSWIGSPFDIFLATVTTVLASYFVAAAVEGYMFKKLTIWERILFFAVGFCLMAPGLEINLAGILGGLIFGAIEWRVGKAPRLSLGGT